MDRHTLDSRTCYNILLHFKRSIHVSRSESHEEGTKRVAQHVKRVAAYAVGRAFELKHGLSLALPLTDHDHCGHRDSEDVSGRCCATWDEIQKTSYRRR